MEYKAHLLEGEDRFRNLEARSYTQFRRRERHCDGATEGRFRIFGGSSTSGEVNPSLHALDIFNPPWELFAMAACIADIEPQLR